MQIQIPAQNLPVAADVDIVVAGGSCTGVFAAITSEEKPLLVTRSGLRWSPSEAAVGQGESTPTKRLILYLFLWRLARFFRISAFILAAPEP